MNFLHNSLAITYKDLRSELRSKDTINASLSFSLVILLLFSFAFDPDSEQVQEISGGLIWIVFAFASSLILARSFARELINDCLDALVASPISPAELFFGKAVANFTLLLAVELFCLPVFGLFYNVSWTRQFPWLLAVLMLGTWGMTVIGTLFSAMTVNLRLREIMLPTLVYPFIIPVMLGSVQLSKVLIGGEPLGTDDQIWFRVLIAFDLVFTLLAIAFADTVLVG